MRLWWQWAVTVVVALVGLGIALALFRSDPTDPTVKGAAASIVVATAAAAVTTAYVFLTHQIANASLAAVQEARAQRESDFRPLVVFEIDPSVPLSNDVPFWVRNFGKGPALHIHVALGAKPAPGQSLPSDAATVRRGDGRLGLSMGIAALPSERWPLWLPGPAIRAILAQEGVCILSAVYEDVFGKVWETRAPLRYRYESRDSVTTGRPIFEQLPARPDTRME